MKRLMLTRAAAHALRARVDASMGLPRVAVLADRIGGGVHVPLEQCVTRTSIAIPDDEDAPVLIDSVAEAHMDVTDKSSLAEYTQTGETP